MFVPEPVLLVAAAELAAAVALVLEAGFEAPAAAPPVLEVDVAVGVASALSLSAPVLLLAPPSPPTVNFVQSS